MEFEFGAEKSAANLKKHGLSLDQAKRLWEVPAVVIEARTVGEERFMTMRGETIRPISARRSHRKEERFYNEIIQKGHPSRGV